MTQFYTDPSRENDKYSLPDAEAFHMSEGESVDDEGRTIVSRMVLLVWFPWLFAR